MATGAWQATVHGVAKSWARLSNFQYTPQHIQVSCMLILHYQLSHKGSSRILQWVAHPFSSRSSQPRSKTGVSCIAGGFFNNWATREALIYITSVQFSRSVVSNSSQPHGLQHVRPPCPSPTPGAYSNSCPLSQWCHPAISSSVFPFSSHIQSTSSILAWRIPWTEEPGRLQSMRPQRVTHGWVTNAFTFQDNKHIHCPVLLRVTLPKFPSLSCPASDFPSILILQWN